jgi:FecR protein
VASFRRLQAHALLGFVMLCGAPQKNAMAFPFDDHALIAREEVKPRRLQFAQAQPSPSPSPAPATPPARAPAAASATPAATDEPIGNVATLTGTATAIRKTDSIALKLKDDIFLNDTVQTSSSASLGITFNDATTFHLSANAKITIDSYVYEEGGNKNAGLFDIGKGTVAFVAASIAKTGNMQINTPAATLGIRGTTGLVEVPEGGAAAGTHNIKLYPDPDGRVGRIEVSDRQGARLGTLTQGASGFAVSPGGGGARASVVPLTISPQQAARDRGVVSQLHQAQTVGRQIVAEQRAIRRANPPGQQQPPRQPGAARPGQPQPGAPKAAPQPGAPKATPQPGAPKGEKQTPGTAPTQGAPNRQGQQQPGAPQPGPSGPVRSGQGTGQGPGVKGQPTTPPSPAIRQGGARPAAPGLQRPKTPRPVPQRPRAPAPKEKKKQS